MPVDLHTTGAHPDNYTALSLSQKFTVEDHKNEAPSNEHVSNKIDP